jgi:hypothetical protein
MRRHRPGRALLGVANVTTIGDVVAAIRAAQLGVDRAVAAARLARADIESNELRTRRAFAGAASADAGAAVQLWARSCDHLDRLVGRLIVGNLALDAYVNEIAPGGARSGRGFAADERSGDELVHESQESGSKLARFMRSVVQNGDDTADGAAAAGDLVKNGMIGNRPGGSGTSHNQAPPPSPANQPGISAPDLAQALVPVTILAVAAGQAIVNQLKKRKGKDSGDGNR